MGSVPLGLLHPVEARIQVVFLIIWTTPGLQDVNTELLLGTQQSTSIRPSCYPLLAPVPRRIVTRSGHTACCKYAAH